MQLPLHPPAKLFSAYTANLLFNKLFIKIKLFLLVFLLSMNLAAQDDVNVDSLKSIIGHNKEDTGTYNALINLAVYCNNDRNFDSSIKYAQEAYSIAKKIGDEKKEADCLFLIGNSQVDYIQAIQSLLNALNIYETLKDSAYICAVKLILQATYREAMDFKTSLIQAFSGVKIAKAHQAMGVLNVFPGHRLEPLFLSEIGGTYVQMNQPDSALIYVQKAVDLNELFNGVAWEFPVYLLATIQRMKGEYDESLKNYRRSLSLAIQNDILWDTLQIYRFSHSLCQYCGKILGTE
jgi:tetratricopeptide (TPR) repeat protein